VDLTDITTRERAANAPKPIRPRRYRRVKRRWPHFLRAWRNAHGLSLDQLAERINQLRGKKLFTGSYLGRVELGDRPYTQEMLEGYADALGCTPGDLLSRAPRDPAAAWQALIAELPGLERELSQEAVSRVTTAKVPRRTSRHRKRPEDPSKKP
jgi:transcriptional regulator with XRE-family HTH domain